MISSRRTISAAVFAALVSLSASPALAQPKPAPATPATDVRAQLPDAARKAWDSGKQLAGANDYKGALVEFQRAYDISKNPRVLYNIGAIEKLLTRYARAVDAWEKELADGGSTLTPAETQELKTAIGVVQQFVALVEVTANENDATLSVDDQPVGKTPFTAPVRVDVGHRTLKLTKEGFRDATQAIDIASGARMPVKLTLQPFSKTGLVTVTVSGAPGATVLIDGKDMGPAPFKGEVSAERHTVEARAPGFVTVGQTIDVPYKGESAVLLTLSAERHEGRLHVTAPEGAEITVDQKKVGVGTWEGVVSTTGGHQVVVTKPGYQTFSTDVFVADDKTRDVDATTLNKQVGTSWVVWGVGTLLVTAGAVTAGYFVFQPANPNPYSGTFNPGTTTAHHGLRF